MKTRKDKDREDEIKKTQEMIRNNFAFFMGHKLDQIDDPGRLEEMLFISRNISWLQPQQLVPID